MKYNYPIKYACMPIIESVGWIHGLSALEPEYDVVCYVVSKCYLFSDKTKYKEKGTTEKEYQVVFPYKTGEYCWKRVTPSPTDSITVEKVFDNYKDALEFAEQKNKELCDKICHFLSGTKLIEKTCEFNDKLFKYKELELRILSNTADLDQSNVEQPNLKTLNNLITYSNGKITLMSYTLYDYLDFHRSANFIVYSISQEQYNKLLILINNQEFPDISSIIESANPILYHDPLSKEKNIMVIGKKGNVLYYINEYGFLVVSDNQASTSIELSSINDKNECIFTTETLKDVVLSFIQYENRYISFDDIEGPVLKKKLPHTKIVD